MEYDVVKIEFKETFKECPTCQYSDGFHSMFEREEDQVRWLIICPACHRVFDIGFTV